MWSVSKKVKSKLKYLLGERAGLDTATTLARGKENVTSGSPGSLVLEVGAGAAHAGLAAIVDGRVVDVVLVGKPIPVLYTVSQPSKVCIHCE